MPTTKQYFSTSLEKGLNILSLFNKERTSISQTEISRLLGLNMTSTYRYINTFVELGFLDKDEHTKLLRPGVRSIFFCTNLLQATDNLRLVRKEVDRIYTEHNISIDVGLIRKQTVTSIYRREAAETMTYNLPEIEVNSLHNTSTGKAFLSTLSDEEMKKTIDNMPMDAKTVHTITDRLKLIEEIKKTQAQGYAMCVEEYLPGLITIGAPLMGTNSGKCLGSVTFDFSILQTSHVEVKSKYSKLIVEFGKKLSRLLTD